MPHGADRPKMIPQPIDSDTYNTLGRLILESEQIWGKHTPKPFVLYGFVGATAAKVFRYYFHESIVYLAPTNTIPSGAVEFVIIPDAFEEYGQLLDDLQSLSDDTDGQER